MKKKVVKRGRGSKGARVRSRVGQNGKKVRFRELVGDEIVFREDKKYRDYLPPQIELEFAALEEGMVRDGVVKDPLVVWHGKLLDGYSRFAIAQKHGLPYRVVELLVETEAEALAWLVEHHIARRHFTQFVIIEMYLGLKQIYTEIAKTNQGQKGGAFEPLHTLEKIARQAECGKSLVHMVETILASKRPKLTLECRTGKKSISRGYYAIKEGASPPPPNDTPAAFANPKSGDFINRIICGDSLKKMREINAVLGGTISLILTSTVFNNGTGYGNGFNDHRDYKKEYLPWLSENIKEFAIALSNGGRLVIEVDSVRDDECKKGGAPYRRNIFADLCKIVEEVAPQLSWFGDICWYKFNPKHYTQSGTCDSCRAPRLARNHSYLLIWSKGEDHVLEHYDISTSDIQEGEWEKMVNSVYSDIPAVKDGMKKYNHPAMWPVKLCDRLIRLFTYPDKKSIVLDPFGGVGSTTLAAYLCGRSYISIEQNADHCRMALKRLAEAEAELQHKKNPKADNGKYTTIE